MKLDFGEKGLWQLFIETFAYIKHQGIKETIDHSILILKRAAGIHIPTDDEKEYAPYDCKYQNEQAFEGCSADVKALAFFLPQFHTIPENDEWWGKGFTEWVNTEKAVQRFEGHYQPKRPHKDIGFYDLSKIETLKRQADMAKRHGIYGFCFYYYWFSGKRLLEKPVDMLLEHPEIDMPFCLCWANENWTRTWSGDHKDVLMAQEYSETDRDRFIDDLKPYFDDKRYIRIDGKPVIVIYNAGEIPEKPDTFAAWRKRAKEIGIGDILIWTCRTANHTAEEMDIVEDIDAEVEFPPHNFWDYQEMWIQNFDLKGKSANIYNYQKLVDVICNLLRRKSVEKKPIYHTCMMAWDNACRRSHMWTTFYGFSDKAFYRWVGALVSDARKRFRIEERFIFVNAWNEWAEGTYLEPDEKYGYANINTFSKAIFDKPFEDRITLSSAVELKQLSFFEEEVKLAVQCHMYYLDTIQNVKQCLETIPYKFDCYISTDSDEKKNTIMNELKTCNINQLYVDVYANKGRDVMPFLLQMSTVFKKYKYICHIHSKKTSNSGYGDFWRDYLYKHLFGNKRNVEAIINKFESDNSIGLIYPDTYPLLKRQEEWGGNRPGVITLLQKLSISANLNHEVEFPVGNMFWARTEAVQKVLGYDWKEEDFPEEEGQVNLTIMHQIERIWKFAIEDAGYYVDRIFNDISADTKVASNKKRKIVFAHYSIDGSISSDDISYLKELCNISDDILFVTNSGKLLSSEKRELLQQNIDVLERENEGYDFGAWKDAIRKISYDELKDYESLYLVNNSCRLVPDRLCDIISKMESKECDVWSMTEFPYISDGSFIGKKCIKKHLQSYFMVFNKNVLNSNAFQEYWESVGIYNKMEEVVANCESELTDFFERHGFKVQPYIEESAMACEHLMCYAIPFERPYQMFLLGNPLIKKKADYTISAEEINIVKDLMRKRLCN